MSAIELNPPFSKKISNTDFSRFIREDSKFSWNIKQRSFDPSCVRVSDSLCTPTFPDDCNAQFKWHVELYPYGINGEVAGYVSIYLKPDFEVNFPVSTDFQVSVENGYESDESNYYVQDVIKHVFIGQETFGWSKFKPSLEFKSFATLACLSIHFKVSAECKANSYYGSKFKAQCALLRDFCNIWHNGMFSDLILCTKQDGKEFKVHRTVLAARSKVFAAMLSSEMRENQTGRIEIEDLSSDTVNELLCFMYSCEVQFESEKCITHLLEASEKYDLMDLKLQCVEYLASVINENNACDILLTGHTLNVPQLKTDALKYIYENRKKFADQSKFQILEAVPELLTEIIIFIIRSDILNDELAK